MFDWLVSSGARALALALLCLVPWAVAVSFPVAADSWTLPTPTVYYAKDKRSRFAVKPRDITSQLDYFQDKVNGNEPAGQRPGGGQAFASGTLERQGADGRWATVWTRQLVNEVAPVRALVANGGSYAVTFDNWHSVGCGGNVVVIYGPRGELVRSMSLSDILPAYYIETLPRSVSSMWWSGRHFISEDDGVLVLQVVAPLERGDRDRRYVERRIRLSTGQVQETNDPAWQRALTDAARVAKANEASGTVSSRAC